MQTFLMIYVYYFFVINVVDLTLTDCKAHQYYRERTRELGPEGPQLAGASSYSNGCQLGKAKNLMFTVLD